MPRIGSIRARMGMLPLAATFLFVVSGGPYGLEPLIRLSGPGMAILLILLIPIFDALPHALMAAELSTMLPKEGGYYVWVKEAMGPFWGFLNGWWTLLYALVDASLYPVYAASLLETVLNLFTQDGIVLKPEVKWGFAIAMIVIFTVLNLLGVRTVGRTPLLFSALLIAPFLLW